MKALARLYYEFTESVRIAWAQIRANKMRSVLTALGVIIGIVAVTLMGTAIRGIDTGFENSLAMLGDDVLYVQKWPWGPVEDWWNYVNRPPIQAADAEKLNRIIENTPNSLLDVAVPVAGRGSSVKAGDSRVDGIYVFGTTADYARISGVDYQEGRLFNEHGGQRRPLGVRAGLRCRRGAVSRPVRAGRDGDGRRPSAHRSSACSPSRASFSGSSASTTSWSCRSTPSGRCSASAAAPTCG